MMTDPAVMMATGTGLKALLLYLGFVFGAAASLAWRAEIGLYLLALMLPLQTTRYHLHGFPLGAKMVDVVLLCVLLGTALRPENPLPRSRRILFYLLALGVFYYVSLWRGAVFLGIQFPVALDDARLIDFKNIMVMPVLAWATMRAIRTRRQIAILLACMAVSLALVNWSYLRTAAGKDFSHYSESVRDAGTLGYAGENGLAAYLAMAIVLLLPFVRVRGGVMWRAALLGLLGVSCYCLLFTYSREAYAAVMVGLVFLAAVRMRWLLLPLVLLTVSWQWALPTAVQERVGMTYRSPEPGEAAQLDHSAQERVELLNDAAQMVQQRPVMGTGFLTYAQLDRVGSYRDTHNYYLKMLVETGFPGLVLFAVQLMLFFHEGWVLYRGAADRLLSSLGLGFCAMMLATMVVNFFGDRWQFLQITSILWIGLGCVVAGSALTQTEVVETTADAAPVEALPMVPVAMYRAGGVP